MTPDVADPITPGVEPTESFLHNITKVTPAKETPIRGIAVSVNGTMMQINSVGMRLNLIPSGEFLMGSDASDQEANANEKPRHTVRIARPFYLGVHEVTRAQYRQVMGSDPSHFSAGPGTSERPVESVSWADAMSFCDKLSEKEGWKPFDRSGGVSNPENRGYRLPTEEEWEYACRAGTTTRFSFGDDDADLGKYAWYHDVSGNTTHPVGQKLPNAFGLFDMHGNVNEWCLDDFHGDYSGRPTEARYRIHRGGAWGNAPIHCRSANRGYAVPGDRLPHLGFRVARDAQ
jgi:formylglycine-generating enzyme required for sulfatase activity